MFNRRPVRTLIAALLVLAFIITTVVATAGIGGSTGPAASAPQDNSVATQLQQGQALGGGSQPKAVLTEFADFQCPACAEASQFVMALHQAYPGLKIVFKHFPLPQHTDPSAAKAAGTQGYPNAMLAARAAEAAGAQGKFWSMYEQLYKSQDSWTAVKDPSGLFGQYARQLGLDQARLTADSNSNQFDARIAADAALAQALQVGGTPFFYLNGQPVDDLSKLDQDVAQAMRS